LARHIYGGYGINNRCRFQCISAVCKTKKTNKPMVSPQRIRIAGNCTAHVAPAMNLIASPVISSCPSQDFIDTLGDPCAARKNLPYISVLVDDMFVFVTNSKVDLGGSRITIRSVFAESRSLQRISNPNYAHDQEIGAPVCCCIQISTSISEQPTPYSHIQTYHISIL
jgi:hypothetical protein